MEGKSKRKGPKILKGVPDPKFLLEASELDIREYEYCAAWSPEVWERIGSFWFVKPDAITGEEILAGAVSCSLVPDGGGKPFRLHIAKFLVREQSRRMGIGTELMERVMKRALIGRTEWVTALVPETWKPGLLFMREMGFTAERGLVECPSSGFSMVRMKKFVEREDDDD